MRPPSASSGSSGGGSESGVERLINAAKKNDVKRIVEEIKSGVDVNSRWGQYRKTALHFAAEKDHGESVKVLLESRADIEARSSDDSTPLIYAAWKGSNEALKLLINAGADREAKNEGGFTALIVAAQDGKNEALKMLLDAGADF